MPKYSINNFKGTTEQKQVLVLIAITNELDKINERLFELKKE